MNPRRGTRRRPLAPAACLAMFAWLAGPAAAAVHVVPSLTFARSYEDNLFAAPFERESDVITRVTPAVELTRSAADSALRVYADLDAEDYASHSELDSGSARERAEFEFAFRPVPRWELDVDGAYVRTGVAGTLEPGAGLEFGRAGAVRRELGAGARYAAGPRSDLGLALEAGSDEVEGGADADLRGAALSFEHRVGRRDAMLLEAGATRHDFDAAPSLVARDLMLGWSHRYSDETALSLHAGWDDSDGRRRPALRIGFEHRSDADGVALEFRRGREVLLGQSGTADTSGLAASAWARLRRNLEWRATATALDSRLAGDRARFYGFDFDLRCDLGRTAALVLGYRHGQQHGQLDSPDDPSIYRNVVSLSMVFRFATPPVPQERRAAADEGEETQEIR